MCVFKCVLNSLSWNSLETFYRFLNVIGFFTT